MPVLAVPAYLLAALAVAGAVVALHLLAWRRPPPTPFPTARFAPPAAIRTVSRDLRLRDRLLLLVRVLAVVLAGLALARPQFVPTKRGTARVLLLDASRRVASLDEVRDSARARSQGADAVSWVRVDSVARVLPDSALGEPSAARGRLSAGLVAAVREAHRLEGRHTRVELVVISPFAAESWDAATEGVRRAWPGAVEVVRVAPRASAAGLASDTAPGTPTDAPSVDLPLPSDPIGAAFARALALDDSTHRLRVTREPLGAADSAWAERGGIVVTWPRRLDEGEALVAPSSLAVLTDGDRSVSGHFTALPLPDGAVPAILRWGDGATAATEQPHGSGCLRAVGINVPERGDEVLRPGFVRLVRALAAPCGGASAAVVDDVVLARWGRPDSTSTTSGPATDVEGAASTRRDDRPVDTTARWLLVAVAVALLAEWWLRRDRQALLAGAGLASPSAREAA
jgi:hypothetical protein